MQEELSAQINEIEELMDEVEEFNESPELTGWDRWSELIMAGVIIAASLLILWLAKDIRQPKTVKVSPRVFPQLVGALMLLTGIWYMLDIIRVPARLSGGEDSEDVDLEAEANWITLIFIGIALVAFALLMEPAGFAFAAAIMFAICSTAMGSKKIWLNLLIGLILGIIVFIVFDRWLGVRLPDGWMAYILK